VIEGISTDDVSPVYRFRAEARYIRAKEKLFALHMEWERNPGAPQLGLRTAAAVDELDSAEALCQEFGVEEIRA